MYICSKATPEITLYFHKTWINQTIKNAFTICTMGFPIASNVAEFTSMQDLTHIVAAANNYDCS